MGHNSFTQAADFVKYLVDSDEALGVHVDAALFQEACCRNTSCRRRDIHSKRGRFIICCDYMSLK